MSTAATTTAAPDREQMTAVERFTFSAGDIFGGGGGALLNVLYLFFLTDVVGLAPAVAGTVFAAAKVFDAFSKPVMGQLTDNTRTRWGRRRPWILAGAPLILVSYLLLWAPVTTMSPAGRTVWAVASVFAYIAVATMVTTPYASMSTETTTSLPERNKLNLMRLGFSTLASALVFVGATALIQAFKGGALSVWTLYAVLAIGFGVLFGLAMLGVALVARERTPLPVARERFRMEAFVRGFKLPAFRSLLGLYLCAMLMMDGIGYLLLAYTTYVARVQSALFMAIIIVTNLVFVVVSQRLVKTVSKNRIYGTLLPLGVVAGAAIALWPAGWPAWPVYVLAFFLAVGIAGSQLMNWVMFPDVVDAGELEFGERTPGSFSGLLALVRSTASALLVFLVGLALQVAGYRGTVGDKSVATQPDSAVWGIRLVLLALVVVFATLGWFLARRYPLTRSVCAQQTALLLEARGSDLAAEPAITAPLRTGFEDEDLHGTPRSHDD